MQTINAWPKLVPIGDATLAVWAGRWPPSQRLNPSLAAATLLEKFIQIGGTWAEVDWRRPSWHQEPRSDSNCRGQGARCAR